MLPGHTLQQDPLLTLLSQCYLDCSCGALQVPKTGKGKKGKQPVNKDRCSCLSRNSVGASFCTAVHRRSVRLKQSCAIKATVTEHGLMHLSGAPQVHQQAVPPRRQRHPGPAVRLSTRLISYWEGSLSCQTIEELADALLRSLCVLPTCLRFCAQEPKVRGGGSCPPGGISCCMLLAAGLSCPSRL